MPTTFSCLNLMQSTSLTPEQDGSVVRCNDIFGQLKDLHECWDFGTNQTWSEFCPCNKFSCWCAEDSLKCATLGIGAPALFLLICISLIVWYCCVRCKRGEKQQVTEYQMRTCGDTQRSLPRSTAHYDTLVAE
eukprot:Sspe_Gene.21267::Locus_7947_Transcript_1_1_Confidence_1.000_Length_1257::g.21267::m.21267